MRNLTLAAALLAVCPATARGDYEQELWNDPGAGNNHWSYFDTDTPAPHDANMTWHATGGVDGSGYVSAPLDALDAIHNIHAYWPAYLYRDIGDNQEIDLTVPDAAVEVYGSTIGTSAVLDLKGGGVYLFIGEWKAIGGPGPEDDLYSFFFNRTPVTINNAGWAAESRIAVGGDTDWGTIASNDAGVNPSDLFYHPQQWGFVIFPATETPAGTLAFDSFRIVPEPATWVLVVSGGMCLLALRRRRAGRE